MHNLSILRNSKEGALPVIIHRYIDIIHYYTRTSRDLDPYTKDAYICIYHLLLQSSFNLDSLMTAPATKRRKIEDWQPKSVSSIEDKFRFSSTTFHSEIPEEVREHPNEPVVLGVDEAGRGPVIGPMVYGISYCLESYQPTLKKQYGFADSKTLKEDIREQLFQTIDDTDDELSKNVGWATTTMTAKDISSGMLQSVMGKGSYNLNEQAHDVTIELIKQVKEKGINLAKIFVDTVGPPATYQAKLSRIFPGIDITVTKKADSIYPIVSTASVVAKVTRDVNLQYFARNIPEFKGQDLGSGYPSDPNTSRWLNSHVDPVFGWNFGLIRFLWQTAKDSLEKNGAAAVVYEQQCMKDGGYQDIGRMFGKENKLGLIDTLFYGSTVSL